MPETRTTCLQTFSLCPPLIPLFWKQETVRQEGRRGVRFISSFFFFKGFKTILTVYNSSDLSTSALCPPLSPRSEWINGARGETKRSLFYLGLFTSPPPPPPRTRGGGGGRDTRPGRGLAFVENGLGSLLQKMGDLGLFFWRDNLCSYFITRMR